MSPPNVPRYPGKLRPAKEVDRRSQHDARVDPESEPPAEFEAERLSRVEEERAVHVRYGKLRIAIPLTFAGVLLGGGGVVGYEKIQHSTPEAAALSDAAHEALNAEVLHRLEKLDAKIDANQAVAVTDQKLLIQRVGTLETNLGATTAEVRTISIAVGARR
jgi:hypothetical protein